MPVQADRFKDQIFIIRATETVLRYTIRDSNNRIIDLTGATLTWTMKRRVSHADTADTAAVPGVVLQKTMTITDATKGKAKVGISVTESDRIGEYVSEVKVVYSGAPQTVFKTAQNAMLFGESVYT